MDRTRFVSQVTVNFGAVANVAVVGADVEVGVTRVVVRVEFKVDIISIVVVLL
jgi:hypothetical protein